KNITEDLEIALRIKAKGYNIENSVNSKVQTVAPESFKSLMKQRVRWFTGLTDNLYSYRSLFGAQQGSLGIFVLPVAVISIFLVLSVTLYYSTLFIFNSFKSIYYIHLINFDIITLLNNYKLDSSFFYSFLNPVGVLFVILIAFAAFTLFLARRFSKDKEKIHSSFVPYLLTYSMLFSIWWLVTIIYKILNIKVRW
ncbi:MAG: glycosyltransferase family 2 protein, partial [Nanoarchaeota archaeon]